MKFKRAYKISLFVLLGIMAMPAIGYVLLQTSKLQNLLVQKLTSELSESLQTKISFNKASVGLFNRLVLDEFYIEDLNKDTLLYAEKLTINIKKFSQKNRVLDINRVKLERSKINFKKQGNILNLKFIVDELKKNRENKSKKERLQLSINNVSIIDSYFSLEKDDKQYVDHRIDFSDLSLNDFQLEANDLQIKNGEVNFEIKSLSFLESKGFELKDLNAVMSIGKDHMYFDDLTFNTRRSDLKNGSVHFSFDSFKDFGQGKIFDNVGLNIKLSDGNFYSGDIAYFSQTFYSLNEQIRIFGNISGKLSNLKGKNIIMNIGRDSYLACNFSINGLPDFKTAFLHLNVDNLITKPDALEKIYLNISENEVKPFAENITDLGRIKFEGSFTGFIDDFVTYGTFNSELGDVKTDLLFRPTGNRSIEYSGRLSSNDFQIGKLIPQNNGKVGAITVDGDIHGSSGPENKLDVKLNTNISKLELNDYTYKNIKISGFWSDTYFNGDININDPNLEMDFSGKIDYSKELAEFNFRTNVTEANLHALNFDKNDSASFASFILNAKGTGKNLDEFNGEIELIQSYFEKTGKQIQLYDVSLIADNTIDSSKISLKSDFIDAHLEGRYEFKYIKESIKQLVNFYLPSTFTDVDATENLSANSFYLEGVFKNTDAFTSFFVPELSLGDNTAFNLYFNPKDSILKFNAFSSLISYKDYVFENISLNSYSENSMFKVETGSKHLQLGNTIFENFTILSDAQNDSISFTSRWLNWDESLYKGEVKAYCKVNGSGESENPKFSIKIPKSEIIMRDSIWVINEGSINIDSTFITLNNIGFSRENQSFLIRGVVSEDPESVLDFEFANFNLGNFNILSKKKHLKLGGILNGTGQVFNIYKDLSFTSNLFVQNLDVNNETIGDTRLETSYRKQKKVIDIFAESHRGKLKTIEIEGEYYPASRVINFDIDLNKLKLNIFSPYVEGVFSELSGLASGDFKINGKLNRPVLKGKIDLSKTSLRVDYLNTRYSFSDVVKIEKNKIEFDKVKVFDENSNIAILDGNITSNYLKDFIFNLNINANNFLFLNNNYNISPNFYGKAFATGKIDITGHHKNLFFNVDATTNQNTNIYIPLGSEEEIATYDFVSFVDHDDEYSEIEEDENNEESLAGINLNFDLTVNSGAEVQVIFDSKMGDIIRGRGYGDLKVKLDRNGNLSMFGDYNITEGDYLFTLQNIINKKFRIEEGGYISWNGEPTDANINIKAIYTTKASLNNLFPEGYSSSQLQGETNTYNKRLPVECQIFLTEKLANPIIDFDIDLPTADADAKGRLEDAISTKDERSMQFLSLLVINSFRMDQSRLQTAENQNPGGAGAIGVTTSELLSNQVSNWLSQISNDFDVGVNYRPDDGISSEELELALSTKILNDRVSISGNLEVGGQYKHLDEHSRNNNIVGDFDVDVKISKSGKLRVKAYNKANDNLFFESDYTQGIGIFYREEFDSFEELFDKYLAKFGVKEKNKSN